jgi:hypothetical protein
MKIDISRDSFDPAKGFSRVLFQQGQVQLDSEANEQGSLFLQALRTMTADLVGEYGGPQGNCGFEIADPSSLTEAEQQLLSKHHPRDFVVRPGCFYVDGIRCETDRAYSYSGQPDLPHAPTPGNVDTTYLVCLDVWEREMRALEDESILEVALGGVTTAARSKVICQVKIEPLKVELTQGETWIVAWKKWKDANWKALKESWQPPHRGRLRVRTGPPPSAERLDASIVSARSRYRGTEDRLYRVEVHKGGEASSAKATFKWSRVNCIDDSRIEKIAGPVVTLRPFRQNLMTRLKPGDWVELVDDHYVLENLAEPLRQVVQVDPMTREVTLQSAAPSVSQEAARHPILRRWDGTADIREGDGQADKEWLTLEEGIQMQFQKSGGGKAHTYRTGDYWLVPARKAIRGVLWPTREGQPDAREPHGIEHHYAALAIVDVTTTEGVKVLADCRPKFLPYAWLAEPPA